MILLLNEVYIILMDVSFWGIYNEVYFYKVVMWVVGYIMFIGLFFS